MNLQFPLSDVGSLVPKGCGEWKKDENPCSNESISKTLESPTVTSSLDTGTCSKSNAGNKFSRADKS